MNLPVSLSEWTWLITETLRHMVSVYGYPQVSSWKFSMEQAMQVSVGNCTMEEYKPFYLATFQAIRSVLPDAEILVSDSIPDMRRSKETPSWKSFFCLPVKIIVFRIFSASSVFSVIILISWISLSTSMKLWMKFTRFLKTKISFRTNCFRSGSS